VLSRHHSKLMIFSEPKRGSSFSFSLPPELVVGVQTQQQPKLPRKIKG
jgi:two-component system phosphate regulon sensor histidine kinase PhoR